MKSKERPWVLTKEGPIHAARRINIKALCMFKFPAKRPLKIQQNPVKELGQDTQRLPEVRDPRDVQHSQSGIKTAQKEYHKIQETKNIYVILKHPVVQQRARKLGE